MVKTAADLHSSQFTVKSHCPRGVGGDFAGILLSTLTATIYKAKGKVSTFVQKHGGLVASYQLHISQVDVFAESWKTSWRVKRIKTKGMKGKSHAETESWRRIL